MIAQGLNMNRLKSGRDHLALLTVAASQARAPQRAPATEGTSDPRKTKGRARSMNSIPTRSRDSKGQNNRERLTDAGASQSENL